MGKLIKKYNKKEGFTIIELILSFVIIVFLAISVATITTHKTKNNDLYCYWAQLAGNQGIYTNRFVVLGKEQPPSNNNAPLTIYTDVTEKTVQNQTNVRQYIVPIAFNCDSKLIGTLMFPIDDNKNVVIGAIEKSIQLDQNNLILGQMRSLDLHLENVTMIGDNTFDNPYTNVDTPKLASLSNNIIIGWNIKPKLGEKSINTNYFGANEVYIGNNIGNNVDNACSYISGIELNEQPDPIKKSLTIGFDSNNGVLADGLSPNRTYEFGPNLIIGNNSLESAFISGKNVIIGSNNFPKFNQTSSKAQIVNNVSNNTIIGSNVSQFIKNPNNEIWEFKDNLIIGNNTLNTMRCEVFNNVIIGSDNIKEGLGLYKNESGNLIGSELNVIVGNNIAEAGLIGHHNVILGYNVLPKDNAFEGSKNVLIGQDSMTKLNQANQSVIMTTQKNLKEVNKSVAIYTYHSNDVATTFNNSVLIASAFAPTELVKTQDDMYNGNDKGFNLRDYNLMFSVKLKEALKVNSFTMNDSVVIGRGYGALRLDYIDTGGIAINKNNNINTELNNKMIFYLGTYSHAINSINPINVFLFAIPLSGVFQDSNYAPDSENDPDKNPSDGKSKHKRGVDFRYTNVQCNTLITNNHNLIDTLSLPNLDNYNKISESNGGKNDLFALNSQELKKYINKYSDPLIEVFANKFTVDNININKMYIKGNLLTKTFNQNSDLRLKNIIGENNNGLNMIRKIKVYDYSYKSQKDKPYIGVLAQEIEKIFPNAVEKKDGILYIKPTQLFFVWLNSIKEISVEIIRIEKENLEIKNRIKTLEKMAGKL